VPSQTKPLLESGQLRNFSLLSVDLQPCPRLDGAITLKVENILDNPIPSEQVSTKPDLVGTCEAREVLNTTRIDARQFSARGQRFESRVIFADHILGRSADLSLAISLNLNSDKNQRKDNGDSTYYLGDERPFLKFQLLSLCLCR